MWRGFSIKSRPKVAAQHRPYDRASESSLKDSIVQEQHVDRFAEGVAATPKAHDPVPAVQLQPSGSRWPSRLHTRPHPGVP